LGVLCASACSGNGSNPSFTGRASGPRDTRSADAPADRTDGSLGDPASEQACTLLSRAEIEAEFGGPVGEATPIYPYCQWLVGNDAFLSVWVRPGRAIADVRPFEEVRFDVGGIGDGAFISSNRSLFFGFGGSTYSIQWQKVGDFTTVESERLQALARDVLARESD
jgi:hypothetical protein